MKKRITSVICVIIILFTCVASVSAYDENGLYSACNYLKTTVSAPEFSSVGGEWSVIALLRSGSVSPDEAYITDYIARIKTYVKENEVDGVLNKKASTDNSRLILALSAAGIDASNFDGVDLVSPLEDVDFVSSQGVNADAYALIALDCKNYLPDSPVREKLIDDILKNEIDDGGWNLDPKRGADVDVTAMVVTALAPYYERDDIKKSVDKALDVLSSLQLDDGGFKSWGTQNCESCATVIIALSALGLDSQTDTRFVKQGGNVYSAMMSFSLESGAFRHTINKKANLMASEQATIALCAYERFKSQSAPLYDYSDLGLSEFIRNIIKIIKAISSFFEFLLNIAA